MGDVQLDPTILIKASAALKSLIETIPSLPQELRQRVVVARVVVTIFAMFFSVVVGAWLLQAFQNLEYVRNIFRRWTTSTDYFGGPSICTIVRYGSELVGRLMLLGALVIRQNIPPKLTFYASIYHKKRAVLYCLSGIVVSVHDLVWPPIIGQSFWPPFTNLKNWKI